MAIIPVNNRTRIRARRLGASPGGINWISWLYPSRSTGLRQRAARVASVISLVSSASLKHGGVCGRSSVVNNAATASANSARGGRGPKNQASSNFMYLGPTPTNWFRSDSHARGRWFNPSNAHSVIKSLAQRTGRRRVARSSLVPTSKLRSRVPTAARKYSYTAPPCLWGRLLVPHRFGP
jgi:hypothetical protein